jgi:uncharacterized protein YheU (UPF0270 family)
MLIPFDQLSETALYTLAQEWVVSNLSESEGHPQVAEWTEIAVNKVKNGELIIEYGEASETVYLKSKDQICFNENEIINE